MGIGIVSITKNDLAGLKRTVQSVRAQTKAPDHLLIVDGASSDGTREWLESEELPAYVSWSSEPDCGVYHAMNKGLRGVKGDRLMFLNSGDVLSRVDMLEVLLDSANANEWAWAYGVARLERGSDLVGIHALEFAARLRFHWGLGTVPHQTVVMSRDLLELIGPFRTDAGLSADQELLLRAWTRVPPYKLREVVAVCDADGLTSRQEAGAFARQMAQHRRDNSVALRPLILDRVVTLGAVAFDRVKLARRGR